MAGEAECPSCVAWHDESEALRAALVGMVSVFAWLDQGNGTLGSDFISKRQRDSTAAALRALGLPDPCRVEDLK